MFKEFIYLAKLLFHNKPKDCKDLEIIKMKYFPFSGYLAMSWCGKLITHNANKINDITFNHETIHLKQAQCYSSWIEYYIRYCIEWLKGNPFITPYNSAYYTIPYEVEAYANEDKPEYTKGMTIYEDNYSTLEFTKYIIKNGRKKVYKNAGGTTRDWKEYIKHI